MGFADLDAVISRAELEEISRSYKRTAGFEPQLLNHPPSLGVGQYIPHGRRRDVTIERENQKGITDVIFGSRLSR
jgi:hypothetical protein